MKSLRLIFERMDKLNFILNDTIKDVCKELEIPIPKVRFVDNFGKDRSLAKLRVESKDGGENWIYTVLMLKKSKFDIAAIFNVVHELRHEYQHYYHKFDFEKHQSAVKLSGHDYGMQPEEIDANAYACGYMYDMFDVQFAYSGWDDETKKAIAKRMVEIYREMG